MLVIEVLYINASLVSPSFFEYPFMQADGVIFFFQVINDLLYISN